jgi:hypothetical protein
VQLQTKRLFLIVITNLVLLTLGIGGSAVAKAAERAWLGFSVAGIAIVTFFGLIALQAGNSMDGHSLRRPIAGAVVVAYLVLVAIFSFYLMDGSVQLPEISKTFITSFTTVVGAIVAFYFGSAAYVEASARRGSRSNSSEPKGG